MYARQALINRTTSVTQQSLEPICLELGARKRLSEYIHKLDAIFLQHSASPRLHWKENLHTAFHWEIVAKAIGACPSVLWIWLVMVPWNATNVLVISATWPCLEVLNLLGLISAGLDISLLLVIKLITWLFKHFNSSPYFTVHKALSDVERITFNLREDTWQHSPYPLITYYSP